VEEGEGTGASVRQVKSTSKAERTPPTTDELDPTTGRRNSRTSRRPPRAEIDSQSTAQRASDESIFNVKREVSFPLTKM